LEGQGDADATGSQSGVLNRHILRGKRKVLI